MKARVHVSLKPSVLDPQGQTISTALNGLGYSSVQSVRQGKYFDLELDDSLSQDEARAQLEKVAHEVLANPVIEEYQVELIS
jgi:phosphoribosylformylglycinamidine synthase